MERRQGDLNEEEPGSIKLPMIKDGGEREFWEWCWTRSAKVMYNTREMQVYFLCSGLESLH